MANRLGNDTYLIASTGLIFLAPLSLTLSKFFRKDLQRVDLKENPYLSENVKVSQLLAL